MSKKTVIGEIQEFIMSMEGRMMKSDEKNKTQKDIFVEFIRIFQKLSQKLTQLANTINMEILNTFNFNDEAINNMLQHLSNALLRLSDCSRNIAVRAKNQVHDPIKIFCDNFDRLNKEQVRIAKDKQNEVKQKHLSLQQNQQAYYLACQKFENYKKNQHKTILKIENGYLSQLQKFNNNVIKLTNNVQNGELTYKNSLTQYNEVVSSCKKEFSQIIQSIAYNEETRLVFYKKSIATSINILHDLTTFFDSSVQRKMEESLNLIQNQRIENTNRRKSTLCIGLISNSNYIKEFAPYEQTTKKQKKQIEENSSLKQIFIKLKDIDKELIKFFIDCYFPETPQKSISEMKVKIPKKLQQKHKQRNFQECKQKIISNLQYSFFFIQILYEKILDVSAFYLKVQDEKFFFLLNAFISITNHMEPHNLNFSTLNIEILYKIVHISTRIACKKKYLIPNHSPIDLLCQLYGEQSNQVFTENILNKIYVFLQKKKAFQKQDINESKGVIETIFKSIMSKKKDIVLSDDEIFSCLTEMTFILANLSIPSQIVIPFIKNSLGTNQNIKSFQYLKSIFFEKKDQQKRSKFLFNRKQKDQKDIQIALQNHNIPEYCIKLTAKKGFFDSKQIVLRQVNSKLRGIDLVIFLSLKLPTHCKWINLIPFHKQFNYISMKQETTEKSIPSAVEEIITLDVNRTLHNHTQNLSPTILHSLLRTYAYFHKDTSYCQGMNYIMGFLFIKMKDEERTFRIFEHLMEKRFKQLFKNQFKVLKLKMYQYERLLGIFHPTIKQNFKKNCISPECYIVSWILTLFAPTYQYTMESYLVDLLWERFIVNGWPEFYKFIFSLFNLHISNLSKLTYDKVLNLLGEISKSQIFLLSKKQYIEKYPSDEIRKRMDQYPISCELLDSLQLQYNLELI